MVSPLCADAEGGSIRLVVIDSLDGCNDSNPTRRTSGVCSAHQEAGSAVALTSALHDLLIHHNNKDGKFRGTSAIKAAVDETWNMRKLESKRLQPGAAACYPQGVRGEVQDGREDMEMLLHAR